MICINKANMNNKNLANEPDCTYSLAFNLGRALIIKSALILEYMNKLPLSLIFLLLF